MEAHVASMLQNTDSEYAMTLSHLILSEKCLRGFAVDTDLLSTDDGFYVEVQIRFRGCLSCSRWKRVPAIYVPNRALDQLLFPCKFLSNAHRSFVNQHCIDNWNKMFPITYDYGLNDWGGLFVSIPVFYDSTLTYDDANTVALRIYFSDYRYWELLFTYSEVVEHCTRFDLDEDRLFTIATRLCQFANTRSWVSDRRDDLHTLTSRLRSMSEKNKTRQPIPILKAATYLDVDTVKFDREPLHQQIEKSIIDETTSATSTLEKIVSSRVSADIPSVRHSNEINAPNTTLRNVANGLGGMLRKIATSSCLVNTRLTESELFGLETPGNNQRYNRLFPNEPKSSLPNLVSELQCVEESECKGEEHEQIPVISKRAYKNIHNIEDIVRILFDLIFPDHTFIVYFPWFLNKISVVPKTDYHTKSPLVIVAYARERYKKHPYPASTTLIDLLRRNGVADESKVPETLLDDLKETIPVLKCTIRPSIHISSSNPIFCIDYEHQFLKEIHVKCQQCFIRALQGIVERTGHNSPIKLYQLISYEINARAIRSQWFDNLSHHVPHLMSALYSEILSEDTATFFKSALWIGILKYISDRNNWSGEDITRFMDDSNIYAFDYYRFGGTCLRKITLYPLVVELDNGLYNKSCRFIKTWDYKDETRFLPGEFHSYLCVGLNRHLHTLVVFPGGFALEADISTEFKDTWSDAFDKLVLERFRHNKRTAFASRITGSLPTCPALKMLVQRHSPRRNSPKS
ncbi:DNA packaging tegument protein [Psittacid alphaherpesvirus 5]|nr:DNA packaging tegument protein [Psittacid alphaherpesvirus 5]